MDQSTRIVTGLFVASILAIWVFVWWRNTHTVPDKDGIPGPVTGGVPIADTVPVAPVP